MKSFTAEDSLIFALPVVIAIIALSAVVYVFPRLATDTSSRASIPTPAITPVTINTETICTSLYEPVCGSDDKTYNNVCEASLAGITQTAPGACLTGSMQPISIPNTSN